MEVKIKTKDFLVDATIEMIDGVMLVSPVADVQLGKEKKTIKERFDDFIEELKKEHPNKESEGIAEAFVLVGVNPRIDGSCDYYGAAKGNKMSICAALTTLFDNDEMIEMLDVASKIAVEKLMKEETEIEQEEQEEDE